MLGGERELEGMWCVVCLAGAPHPARFRLKTVGTPFCRPPGDGTLMWTCHIFGNRAVPPLLPFNLGSLGFLTPFAPEELPYRLSQAVQGKKVAGS